MTDTQFRFSEEVPGWLSVLLLATVAIAIFRLVALYYTRKAPKVLVITGAIGYVLLLIVALRPVRLIRRGRAVGPRVIALVDSSRRLELRTESSTRADQAQLAVSALLRHYHSASLSIAMFGEGAARMLKSPELISESLGKTSTSDMLAALSSLLDVTGERPAAVLVVSDGRFTRPFSVDALMGSSLPAAFTGIPIHSVDVGGQAQPDASIRLVDSLGEAVAHQAISLKVEIACSGELRCGKIPVAIRALEKGKSPREIARREADLTGKEAQLVNFDFVLEHAGSQILEVALENQPGDRVPENDARLLPYSVSRDRLRLLHIAGSPSYDVRELRRWLKGNSAVDLVSYFILRTDDDNPNTEDNAGELSLIPFPVDELFSQHLPSFDAVILQDIDAARYHLDTHLERLARYVEEGGGLILVGGSAAFSGGNYAHSALERVIPTSLVLGSNPYDSVEFVPRVTTAAMKSPILEPLQRILGNRLPSFPGSNTLGPPKSRATVLWEHPQRTFLPIKGVTFAGPMPILAVSDIHDGRVVEIGLDATFRLGWGSMAAETSGRAYGALWEALIGWVMHEQQYASMRGEILGECIANSPLVMQWFLPAGARGLLTVDVEQLGQASPQTLHQQVKLDDSGVVTVQLPGLRRGGFCATARLDGGAESRLNFLCEKGGVAMADSRPDHERLRKLSEISGGTYVMPDGIDKLPLPPSYFLDEKRTSHPVAPCWLWASLAAAFLGAQWIVARSTGFR
jgi:uncharacterized membrane protein